LFWCPFCILLVCLGAPLRFFNAISFITYKKKAFNIKILFLLHLMKCSKPNVVSHYVQCSADNLYS